MTKATIAIPIYLSPVILLGILLETSANNAYSPESDSLGIPLFSYIFFWFPIALYLLSKVKKGRLQKPRQLFWNSRRHGFSAASMILTIFPLALFWIGFLLIGLSSGSLGTIFGSILLLITTLLVRTLAIQSEILAEQDAAGQPATRPESK